MKTKSFILIAIALILASFTFTSFEETSSQKISGEQVTPHESTIDAAMKMTLESPVGGLVSSYEI